MASEWLVQSVRYFRELAFFSQQEHLSDEALADMIEAQHQEEYGEDEPLELGNELVDLLLLRYDPVRVWWDDTEADVAPQSNMYVQTLHELGAISRGVFVPEEIVETWAGPAGPITVEFNLHGVRHRIYPQYLEDYIDIDIIQELNSLIQNTGYQFAAYEDFDQTAFLVVLTKEEKHKLELERGWRFSQ